MHTSTYSVIVRRFLFFVAVAFLATIPLMFLTQDNNILRRVFTTFFPQTAANSFEIKGIGVLGDSLSDEFQADDARGFQYSPTTLNWIEQLVKNRNINFGTWNVWGDVRRTGFGYNWSQTGATSETLLSQGQHTGLAQKVVEGKVNVVFVYIGANDFFPTSTNYLSFYRSTLTKDEEVMLTKRIVSNIQTAAITVNKNNAKIFLVTIPDWNLQNASQFAFPDGAGRLRVSAAIQTINTELQAFATKNQMYTIDSNAFYQRIIDSAPLGSITVGSEPISFLIPDDEPHHAFLGDGIHPGTIMNGLFARFILELMNTTIGTTITPLTDEEILDNAGL